MLTDLELKPLIKMLVIDEGYKQFAYDDATGEPVKAPKGFLTIGIGLNIQATGLTYDEAVYLCTNRVRIFENNLASLKFYSGLSLNRQYVLINLAFNLGFGGLMEFHKMMAALEKFDFEVAASELLDSSACKQLPGRYHRLAVQLATNIYQYNY